MRKLKEKLNAKLSKNGGFTLVEMLIVVAIIAILIAVSIPMFSSTLEKARHGVDAANIRNAISMGTAEYLGSLDPKTEFKDPVTYAYIIKDDDNHQARLEEGTETTANIVKMQCAKADKDKGLTVTVKYDPTSDDGVEVTTNWTISSTGNGHPVHKTPTPA